MNVFPTLKLGKFGQATTPQLLHPSAEKLNPPGGIGKRRFPVNTPTLTWVYTRKEGI